MKFVCGKTIVVSGINIYEGGMLSVYRDFIKDLIDNGIAANNNCILFVHNEKLFKEESRLCNIIELPRSRKSYLLRLYYEYVFFYIFSTRHHIDFWISMHDVTPNVKAGIQYTYCHNPSPFYKIKKLDWRFNKTLCLFRCFYKYIYGINIKKAKNIIVQQEWIRKEFKKRYGVSNVIVSRPFSKHIAISNIEMNQNRRVFTFIFPSYPRSYKHFEVICEACRIIESYNEEIDYEVLFTINGEENEYSQYLFKMYGKNAHIKWIGLQKREDLLKIYQETDCMIFPSKLETWGLPISEYKITKNPILLIDLPYAHETIGEYSKTVFFNDDSQDLAIKMIQLIQGEKVFKQTKEIVPEEPYARSWDELSEFLFGINNLSNSAEDK